MAEEKRPVSPINGVPLPKGRPFEAGERAREAGRKGGQNSQKRYAERKTLREELMSLLTVEITDRNSGKTMQTQAALSAALIKQALSGNTRAYEIIRDTIGEKPVENIMVASPDTDVLREIAERMEKGK